METVSNLAASFSVLPGHVSGQGVNRIRKTQPLPRKKLIKTVKQSEGLPEPLRLGRPSPGGRASGF